MGLALGDAWVVCRSLDDLANADPENDVARAVILAGLQTRPHQSVVIGNCSECGKECDGQTDARRLRAGRCNACRQSPRAIPKPRPHPVVDAELPKSKPVTDRIDPQAAERLRQRRRQRLADGQR